MFRFKIVLAILNPFYFQTNFRMFCQFLQKGSWYILGITQFIDRTGENWHPHGIIFKFVNMGCLSIYLGLLSKN